MRSHDHAMNILPKLVIANNELRQLHHLWPISLSLRHPRQSFEQPQILLPVITALLFDPGLVASLHKLSAVKRERAFISANTFIKLPCSPRVFTLLQEPIE